MPIDCRKCKHRECVPGSAHSACGHPKAGKDKDALGTLMAAFASVKRTDPVIGQGAIELEIRASAHGIRQGWFNWPWDFDPVWLENCNGFEEVDNGTMGHAKTS